jgi:hypothetical protein
MKVLHDRLDHDVRRESAPIHPLAAEREQPPRPRLQETPAIDLREFRAREDERLSTYGWVDRSAGIVRVPIERAIEIVAREGLPVRKEAKR